jgi:prevent-host-death family protein
VKRWSERERVEGHHPENPDEHSIQMPVVDHNATIMYMLATVGVAELRQNLSRYLQRVSQGERLVVTDHNRPVAELGPPPTTGSTLDRLVAEGRVARPARRGLPEPLELDGDPYALSRALDEIRGER